MSWSFKMYDNIPVAEQEAAVDRGHDRPMGRVPRVPAPPAAHARLVRAIRELTQRERKVTRQNVPGTATPAAWRPRGQRPKQKPRRETRLATRQNPRRARLAPIFALEFGDRSSALSKLGRGDDLLALGEPRGLVPMRCSGQCVRTRQSSSSASNKSTNPGHDVVPSCANQGLGVV